MLFDVRFVKVLRAWYDFWAVVFFAGVHEWSFECYEWVVCGWC